MELFVAVSMSLHCSRARSGAETEQPSLPPADPLPPPEDSEREDEHHHDDEPSRRDGGPEKLDVMWAE